MFEQRLPYGLWDADQHFAEPERAIPDYIDPRFRSSEKIAVDVVRRERDRIQAAAKKAGKTDDEIWKDDDIRRIDDGVIVPGTTLNKLNPWKDMSAAEREARIAEFRELSDASSTVDGRLSVMDAQGVEGALIFPQREGLIVHDCFPDDVEATYANVRAFNRFTAAEWGFAYKERIFIPAVISFLDVDLAVKELEQVIADGARTVLLPPGPINRQSPADPKFDPFWARAQEAGMNIAVHLNYTEYQQQSAMWSENPDAHFTQKPGFTAFQWFSYWGDRPMMELSAALIFHNLFTRFPNIRVCLSEQGSVWVNYAVRKMDHGFMLGRPATFGERLPARPSDIFREHFVVAPFPEESVNRTLEVLSIDQLVFGSDFPHAEGLDDPSKYIATIAALSEEDQKKMMRDNMADFLLGHPID
ncbi:MAG TPA: amidohydrolase family protein [Acidimicrobiia bacterium]